MAIGAIVDGGDPDIVLNEDLVRRLGISQAVLAELIERELEEIERRKASYGKALSPPLTPTGRPAIIVDDGMATGATVRAAVKALRRRGATQVIVAVPVAPPDAVAVLEAAGTEVVREEVFRAAGVLERFHPRVTSCRVSVTNPGMRHRQGALFDVRVVLPVMSRRSTSMRAPSFRSDVSLPPRRASSS